MSKKYSIAEARHNFAALVHEVEASKTVEITRRGEAVAVLVTMKAYLHMLDPKKDFWAAYQQVRAAHDFEALDIQPEIFNVRAPDHGREFTW